MLSWNCDSMSGYTLWRYRRPFSVGGTRCEVVLRSRTDGLHSELLVAGAPMAVDYTPIGGEDAVRNHRLAAVLPDGRQLNVEAGWISSLNAGIAVRLDGELIHESHQGRTIVYPEKFREQAIKMSGKTLGEAFSSGGGVNYDAGVWKRNKIPLSVDIALGLLFFVVAKLTDLTTAAFVGAAAGLILLIAQRLTKVDLLGGLAMFGIAMLLISALLAFLFQSDEAVKYRTTVMGLIGAVLFLADGLAGGKRLGVRMKRYLPYTDIDPARLMIGMGVLGIVMAGANQAVAMLVSTDVWLFYSTFADFALTMVLILLVFRYARGEMWRDGWPRYATPERTTMEMAAQAAARTGT